MSGLSERTSGGIGSLFPDPRSGGMSWPFVLVNGDISPIGDASWTVIAGRERGEVFDSAVGGISCSVERASCDSSDRLLGDLPNSERGVIS